MSNFNEFFKNKGAKIIVDRFLDGVDKYSDNKITNLQYTILNEPPQPTSYYVENGLTATFKVDITYSINDGDEIFHSGFEVPKEMDGLFVIEGAYRMSYNRLEPDFDCRIRTTGSGDHKISFDYERKYDIHTKVLSISKMMPGSTLSERELKVNYDDIDSVPENKKELLKLTELQSKKLQIKLDLDYKPEYITKRLIQECIAFGDDREKDLIIDKTIESVSSGFMNFLFRNQNKSVYRGAKRKISFYYNKYGKLPDPINFISSIAFRYFKGGNRDEMTRTKENIAPQPGINAINLESIGQKITIPATVAYNPTFADLIDFADTPNNNNVNLQNSLTVSTHITENGVLFDVFDKDFKKITIAYIDYLNSKVVASEYVDYENNKLKPNKDNEVEVKYRMKRKMVKVDEIDLIDLHPDYRLSSTARRIPFINSTDSVRIAMGCGILVSASKISLNAGRYIYINQQYILN